MACAPNTALSYFATSMYTFYKHPCFKPQLTMGVSHLLRRCLLSHLTMSTEERLIAIAHINVRSPDYYAILSHYSTPLAFIVNSCIETQDISQGLTHLHRTLSA